MDVTIFQNLFLAVDCGYEINNAMVSVIQGVWDGAKGQMPEKWSRSKIII